MKNYINYYYNINVVNIQQKGKNYYFKINDKTYNFIVVLENSITKNTYELNSYLVCNNFPVHKIILNVNNEIISKINENLYVLLELTEKKVELNLNNVFLYNNINIQNYKMRTKDWGMLWSEKLDYFEYQISQIGKKYPILRESFNYFLGLGELAISIVNNTDRNRIYYSLSHKRIEDLCDPLSLIIDIRVRDVCEYFKYKFFNNENIDDELNFFITNNSLMENEKNLFLARMLFPTYYFDMYEKIIKGEIEEIEIKKIIVKVNDYEKNLRKIYNNFNNNLHINWLESFN